jgi:ATP-dependent 26S proteasome regulatory subunit
MNKTEIIQYQTILKMFERLQEKAIEHGAVVFMDGEPSFKQNPFFYHDDTQIGVQMNEQCKVSFFDVGFDNPSSHEIKEMIDDQFSVWKRIED